MKDRILRLCKRLDKFSLDEIETISEIETEKLVPILTELKNENRIIQKGNIYYYNKICSAKRKFGNLPLCFQFHSKEEIDYILKGFCCDIEVLKMIDLFGLTKHTLDKFYNCFRMIIYERQLKELLEHFEKTPKMPQERVYMNTKVYLYLYNGKLYVSEKYLVSKDARKHREEERLEIKNIYLRSYRKVLSKSFAYKFHLHLAEEIWKWGKEFNERYISLNKILFS